VRSLVPQFTTGVLMHAWCMESCCSSDIRYGEWRNSEVGIATLYRMDGPGIKILLGGGWFSPPVRNVPGAYSASDTVGTTYLSRGQSGRSVALTTHPHLAPKLKKEWSYTSTLWLSLHGVLYGENYLYSFTFTFNPMLRFRFQTSRITFYLLTVKGFIPVIQNP